MIKNLTFFSLLLPLFSCQIEIKPIDYGTAECDYCRMTIVDERYAAELVTSTSKAYVFDAAECMIRYMNDNVTTKYSMIMVTDFMHPRQLIDAKKAFFIRSKNLPSPMGMYITSLSTNEKAEEMQKKESGLIYNYQTLLEEFPSMEPL